MMKTSAVLLLLSFLISLSSQGKIDSTKNSPVILVVSYKLPVNRNVMISSGHGTSVELGVNPLYFVSESRFLGVYAGMAMKDRLWSTSFDPEFSYDYAHSLKDFTHSGMDSAIIQASKTLFSDVKGNSIDLPGCESRSFHSSAFYGGIITKLPGERYPILLKLYAGVMKTSFQGNKIVTKNTDYNYFAIKRPMYGFEISLFPGKKFSDSGNKHGAFSKLYLGTVSFYYEYCSLSQGSLYFTDGDVRRDLAFKSYLSEGFTDKYKKESSFGIKLSVNIY